MNDDSKQLVLTYDEIRPIVLLAMATTSGRTAILGKAMELLRGRANPAQVLKVIDEELE